MANGREGAEGGPIRGSRGREKDGWNGGRKWGVSLLLKDEVAVGSSLLVVVARG